MEKQINIFAEDLDSETKRQFEECISKDFVVAAALMPDAHSGYAAPIGAVIATKQFIVPAWVGYDIGCGLIAIRIKGKKIVERVRARTEKIYEKLIKEVPMGMGEYSDRNKISKETKEKLAELIRKFEKGPHNKNILSFLKNSSIKHVGTLGGGNHFIELSTDDDEKELWLIIHSGSRGIGHRVAETYMIKAASSEKNFEKTFPLDVNSQLGKEYLNILEFGLDFALLNRLEMAKKVLNVLEEVLNEKISHELWTNKNHNHAILEKGLYIHRKGATPAKKGEKGIIPGNMRDGCFLVEGKGNKKFLNSSSHGAGRAMSRKKAMETITLEQFKKSMKGIKGNIEEKIIPEAPMAYKDLYRVMAAQKESIKILKHLKPIINWKGK